MYQPSVHVHDRETGQLFGNCLERGVAKVSVTDKNYGNINVASCLIFEMFLAVDIKATDAGFIKLYVCSHAPKKLR